MRKTMLTLCVLGLVIIVAACGGDNGTGPEEIPFDQMHLDLFNVATLGSGMVYELWSGPPAASLSAASENWISLGRFNVAQGETLQLTDPDGNPVTNNTLIDLPVDLKLVDSIYVTIEPQPDTDSLPSGVVIMSGSFENSQIIELAFSGPDFTNTLTETNFTLVTPTDAANDSANELSGVWFMLPSGVTRTGLRNLPDAIPGWVYQGWVEHDGFLLSTGRFTSAEGTDLDSLYSASDNPAPEFPGEDFILNSPYPGLDFPFVFTQGDNVWVTLEPSPDPDPATPFPLMIYEMRPNQIINPEKPYFLDRSFVDIDDLPSANAVALKKSGE